MFNRKDNKDSNSSNRTGIKDVKDPKSLGKYLKNLIKAEESRSNN